MELRKLAEKTLATVHMEAKIAWDNGATETEMKPALKLIRPRTMAMGLGCGCKRRWFSFAGRSNEGSRHFNSKSRRSKKKKLL
jgi:hypothetical protein